jgi:16S rRNA (guanine1207-N2)-methyltransferase
MSKATASAVYGAPALAAIPAGARQFSPLVPGADALEQAPDASLDSIVIAAPPGVIERRYVLAQALRALKPGGDLTAVAPKDKGGLRLRTELQALGCVVAEQALRHQRLCQCLRPDAPVGLAEAIAAGGPQTPARLGLSSQPGVFSWDRPDPGSVILARHLAGLAGVGADLGCGVGVLALALLAAPKITALALVDIDRRAIDAARRNVADPRASFLQADLREPAPSLSGLDFVVMNPPFHDGGDENRELGQAFVRRAAASLRRGGLLRLVANIGLPYEATLAESFDQLRRLEQSGGYKVLEGRRT